jgi:DNA-binding Lrp family transcriptional regulator
MTGRKSKVLIDSIDLDILTTLNDYSYNLGLGVLELAEKIKLTHQNLKRHLEKLVKARLVFPLTYSSSNKINLVTCYWFHDLYDGDNAEKVKKDIEEYEVILAFLKKINSLDYEKETISKISKEIKDNFSKRINYKQELNRLKQNEKIADEVIKERKNDTNAPKPNNSKHKKVNKK